MALSDTTPTGDSALITAILPLKNHHERFLRAALRSMFEQTSSDWRLLVVVEPAESGRFAELLADELSDHRVVLIVNTGRKLAGAINSGMRAATTPFVAILLGDDRWDTRAVEVLKTYIARFPNSDFFHSARRLVDEDDRPISSIHPACESFSLADFPKGSPVKHLLCWRREFGLAVGGLDETLNSVGPDDYDFPWVMAEGGARFTAIQECLYIYRDHREAYRLTTHLPLDHHKKEIKRILRKHGVPAKILAKRLRQAEAGYLRQCLYRSHLDRLWKALCGFDPRRGWRERYR
jgi:glycosyltransferase involved in cell wall biosynthesis